MSELKCVGGTSWKSLKRKMATVYGRLDTESCEYLCKKQNEFGCCHLSKTTGCAWLPDGKTSWDGPSNSEVSKSSICMYKGTVMCNYRNNFFYIINNRL